MDPLIISKIALLVQNVRRAIEKHSRYLSYNCIVKTKQQKNAKFLSVATQMIRKLPSVYKKPEIPKQQETSGNNSETARFNNVQPNQIRNWQKITKK